MNLIEKIKALFRPKQQKTEKPTPAAAPGASGTQQTEGRMKKACKSCGKMFSYDPGWDHVPNYCKECRRKFAQEKEEKQRAGAPRKIQRKCRACGNFFTFPSTLAHYPNYCSNCRKKHQAEMKAKYSRKQG